MREGIRVNEDSLTAQYKMSSSNMESLAAGFNREKSRSLDDKVTVS